MGVISDGSSVWLVCRAAGLPTDNAPLMVQTHTKPMVGSRTMTKHAVVRLYLGSYLGR